MYLTCMQTLSTHEFDIADRITSVFDLVNNNITVIYSTRKFYIVSKDVALIFLTYL